MKLKILYEKLNYFSYDKETYKTYKKDLDLTNIKVLSNLLGVIFFIFVFVIISNFIISKNLIQLIISGAIALSFLGLIFFDFFTYKKFNTKSSFFINLLIDLCCIICYSLGIFLGVFQNQNNYAVSIIIMMIIFQVLFDRVMIHNFLTTFVFYIIFIILSFKIKDFSIAIYDFINTSVAMFIAMLVSWNKGKLRIKSMLIEEQLLKANNTLYQLGTTDTLTGLKTRAKIFEYMNRIKSTVIKSEQFFFCIIIDIDNFKLYNDTYGHPVGDKLLSKIGEKLLEISKNYAVKCGRIGGEEFMVIGQSKEPYNIQKLCYEIKDSIYNLKIEHKKSEVSKYVTVSIGLYYNKIKDNFDMEKAYITADKAFYLAKNNGKNCCWKYNLSSKKFSSF